MKTKETKIKTFTLLIVLLTIFGQNINSQDYQTFYLDSINNNDTIIYCLGNDSIRLIPPTGADVWAWLTDGYQDTIYVDTLILVNGYEGLIGCQGTGIDVGELYIYPFEIDVGQDNALVCGGSIQLDGVTSNYTGTGSNSYSWQPTTGLNDSTIANPTVTIIQDLIYTVTVLTPNGCEITESIQVYVDPLIIEAGEDKTIVCGGTAEFDDVFTNYTGTDILSYSWYPATGLNNSTISNPTSTVTNTTTYTVTISTTNGCQATDSLTVIMQSMDSPEICMVGVDSTNKNIIVWEKPVSNSIDSFYIYKETNVTNIYQKISAITYNEYSVYTDTSSRPNIQSNKYEISLLDTCGIESDRSLFHKTMHLSINQGQNNVWNLIWESYEGFTVSTYFIYRGTNQNDLQLIGSSPASNTQYSDFSAPVGYVYYQIEIVRPYDCNPAKTSSNILKSKSFNKSRSNIATNSPTGLNENLMDSKLFAIYPNPTNNEVIVEFNKNSIENGIIKVTDLNGQVIKKVIMHSYKTIINIDRLNSGIYAVHIITDKGIIIKKIIKI